MNRTNISHSLWGLDIAIMFLLALPHCVSASVTAQSGAYYVELATTPSTIRIGKAQLLIKVTDASGKPIEGATIRSMTKMPGMNMGEREATAAPQRGQPGVYAAPAQFAMEGGYEAALKIDGLQGSASVTVPLTTGQDTGTLSTMPGQSAPAETGAKTSISSLLPWLIGGLLVAFVLYRVWRTGQRPDVRAVANRSVLGGLLLLALFLAGAVYAVNKYRRPGSMTPIEAQGMQMELPAPAGTAPVELTTVERGRIESTVRYTGQAVGFVEQDVTPRVTGVITWMPLYVGDKVKRGQVLARLDTSQSAPQVAGQRAGLNMATQGVDVARKEYQQAQAAINEAHAEVGSRRGAVEGAKADLKAAQEERGNAEAQLDAAQSMTTDATAQLQAAQADQQYWQQEIAREQTLLKAGAVTQDEYQREKAQAENADAKVRQAQARITQVQAQVRAAQSAVRKAEAMIASSTSKIAQAQSELEAHFAHVRSTQAMADSAHQKIAQAQAGVQQAKASLAGASASQGYSEIRSQTEGVVTERLISPGVLVNPGQVILRIAQIAPIRLQANVPEADLSLVRVGSRVLVSGRNGESKPIAARVTSVAPLVDPAARTGVVEAILPNGDSRFLPGQYVTMDISTGSSAEALLVPTRALRYHTPPSGNVVSTQSVPSLWVAEPLEGQQNQFTVREVTVRVGRNDGRNTEILSGLQAGQKVVTAGQDYLKNGDTVSTMTANADATPRNTDSVRQAEGMNHSAPVSSPASNTVYTCIMHPEVVQDHPGDCPKCGMKLVPKRGGAR